VPSHLYKDLPKHLLIKNENGDLVPDYLKMILLCKSHYMLVARAHVT
jgi:hypothetical protein